MPVARSQPLARPSRSSQSRRIAWPAVAERLAQRIPREKLHPAVLRWAQGKGRALRGTWGVGISGGADSVALLLLLWVHWPERRVQLAGWHFHHALRGREATMDQAFCRSLCRGLGLAFATARWNRPRSRGSAKVSEAQARTARFAFFQSQLQKAQGRVLWLGHQKDDIAESQLMRLARGSGTGGLAAPRPVQIIGRDRVHLRPLLTVSRAGLRADLKAAGGRWREDATNRSQDYLRNRMREDVVPAWVRTVPDRDVMSGAALSRELLEEDDAALEAWVGRLRPLRGRVLDLNPLRDQPRAVVRRALQRWRLALGERAGDLSRAGFAALLEAVERAEPKRLSLGRNGFAVIADSRLRWAPSKE